MSERIIRIDYYDYTHKIGRVESLRDFASLQITYFGLAISTPEVHVNVSPNEFKISSDKSNALREYAIPYLSELEEISAMLAKNSPQYICIQYYDGSTKYYKYHATFCKVFNMAWKMDPKESIEYKTRQYYEKEMNKVDVDSLKAVAAQPTTRSPINSYFPTQSCSRPVASTANPSTRNNTSFSAGKIIIWLFVIICLLALMISAVIGLDDSSLENTPAQTAPTLTPVTEPLSGTVLSGTEVYGESELTINASSSDSYLVKLKTQSGITRLTFYVRAGDTVTVGVPNEDLYVYFASGSEWYGMKHLFGESTSYSMDDEIKDFWQYTYEYTLYPVTNGNFSETPIDAEDF